MIVVYQGCFEKPEIEGSGTQGLKDIKAGLISMKPHGVSTSRLLNAETGWDIGLD